MKIYILALKFDYFAIAYYRALHLKWINIVFKWSRPSKALKQAIYKIYCT